MGSLCRSPRLQQIEPPCQKHAGRQGSGVTWPGNSGDRGSTMLLVSLAASPISTTDSGSGAGSSMRASRVCSTPGCPAFAVPGGTCCDPCLSRRRAESDTKRGPDRQWYGTTAWRKLRALVLAQEPTCYLCHQAPSTIVDHLIPRKERPDLAMTRSNLRGSCKPCHDSRTASETGFGARDGQEPKPAPVPEPKRWVIA